MNRLRETRKEKGLSQNELAKLLGTSRQAISLYERGDREPKMVMWKKFSNALEVSVPYLQGVSPYKNIGEQIRKEVLKGRTFEEWKKDTDKSMTDYFAQKFQEEYQDDFPNIENKEVQANLYRSMNNYKDIFSLLSTKPTHEQVSHSGISNMQKEYTQRGLVMAHLIGLIDKFSGTLFEGVGVTNDHPYYDSAQLTHTLEAIDKSIDVALEQMKK
ncbi:helix-turn-helix transcriptional regulator [Levilactobacillus lanxiensis]|uniref:Helix-turn-helix transcriptional regulator n=2 Tax=Levilactobacillus lanxiensis TaxID=2799568 RepID=A0ABW4D839_9LACO|nr:helix-turn-helix transcriptional regulator [Levilactobacillus lanxiensis]